MEYDSWFKCKGKGRDASWSRPMEYDSSKGKVKGKDASWSSPMEHDWSKGKGKGKDASKGKGISGNWSERGKPAAAEQVEQDKLREIKSTMLQLLETQRELLNDQGGLLLRRPPL